MSPAATVDPTLARQIARELALPIVEELLEPLADLIASRLAAGDSTLPLGAPKPSSASQGASEPQSAGEPHLVDAATVARRLGVSRDYVYSHADELGGWRLGDGPRGRLRFDLDQALDAWTTRSTGSTSQQAKAPAITRPSRPRRRRQTDSTHDLLPIRGSFTPQERMT